MKYPPWSTWLMLAIFMVGVLLLGYPSVSNYWNQQHQSQAITQYEKTTNYLTNQKKDDIVAAANAYNQSLVATNLDLNLSTKDKTIYNRLLDTSGTGMMGVVEIPKLSEKLPIYHGSDEAILQVAIGHIPGTSLPIGGKGTHAVISGHRGLPSARLFSDIDQLVNGDIFLIHVLNQTLTYEVDQITIVLPDDISSLAIDPDQDYVTLVTCTPYGVNTHRLLVRGHRVETVSTVTIKGEAIRISPLKVMPFFAVILCFSYFLWKYFWRWFSIRL